MLVTGPCTKYSFRAVDQSLRNYNQLIPDTRSLAVGRKRDTAKHCEVTNPAGEIKGLTARTARVTITRLFGAGRR